MKARILQPQHLEMAIACGIALLLGLFLRLYLLPQQVFIDDEWHGFYYALGKSPGWLLTNFSIPGATCIPFNFYNWLVGATVGWTEMTLRLPSLIFGVLMIIVPPLLVRGLMGDRRAALLGFFLAISPILIFYSRIARPYSGVAFLSFTAVLLAARWMQSNNSRDAVLFVVVGALAIYFHLFAVVTVAAPVLMALLFHTVRSLRGPGRPSSASPTARQWWLASAGIAAISGVLLGPALIGSLRGTFFTVALVGQLQIESVPKVLMLMSGTGHGVLILLFWAGVIGGAIDLCRRNPWFGWTLVSLYPLHILSLLLTRPDAAQSGIVLARYCIALVPVSLLLCSSGIYALLERIAARSALRPAVQLGMAFACAATMALSGPLAQTYISPNNFTSHGAYQHSYRQIDWNYSFRSDLTPAGINLRTWLSAREVSPFYTNIARQPKSHLLVEYPMLIGDHFNPLYYYQNFHQQPVLVGYSTNMTQTLGLAAGNVYGDTYIDQVLTRVQDSSRLKFRNLISMDDLEGMRARGVDYVILHKLFEAELARVARPSPEMGRLLSRYQKELKPPVYEDSHLVVFPLQ